MSSTYSLEGEGGGERQRGGEIDKQADRQTETDGNRDRETNRQKQRQRETETENSNSKTLFYKDCSLGSVRQTDKQTDRQSHKHESKLHE